MRRGPRTRGGLRAACAHALLGAAVLAQAAEGTAPRAVDSPVSLWSLLQVVLALLVVLAVIGLFAWLMRRLMPGQGMAGGLLRVVGGVMVGPKERLVVVEVGDTWLLLGVAASNVTLVHTMPKPLGASAAPAGQAGTFARLLGQALGRTREEH